MVDRFRRAVAEKDAILMSIPNEVDGGKSNGLLAAMGRLEDAPDLMLLVRGEPGQVIFIEVKLKKTFHHERTETRPGQDIVHGKFRRLGVPVHVFRTLTELQELVDRLGIPHKPWDTSPAQTVMWFPTPARKRKRSLN